MDPTLFLFDGSNLFHAGAYEDREGLVNDLASYVGAMGARGVVVFDGVGVDVEVGPLAVRYAPHADEMLERLAASERSRERVVVVTSDAAIRTTSGQEARKVSSEQFLTLMGSPAHAEPSASRVRDRLDDETRARLERLRRGQH